MKNILVATVLAAAGMPAMASNVGVSIHLGQPGLQGRVDIGNVWHAPFATHQAPRYRMAPQVVARPPVVGLPRSVVGGYWGQRRLAPVVVIRSGGDRHPHWRAEQRRQERHQDRHQRGWDRRDHGDRDDDHDRRFGPRRHGND